jgi:hypothetical protein
MPAFGARGIDGDPIRMRIVHVLMRRVRIGARNHDHVQLPAAEHQFAERVTLAEPLAAIMQRNFRRVIGDASTRAEAGGIGMGALEIIKPEAGIVLARIVFDQRQLRPAHRPVEPRIGLILR